jgi:hypothetical protein
MCIIVDLLVMQIFSWSYTESCCTHPDVSVTVWLSFCVQVGFSKTTVGNGLKLHTHIWEHNWMSMLIMPVHRS